MEKLQSDLDLACLKTIVALLHQLPLQPIEPVHESDALLVKSRIFYKYFTYFFKLLNRCRVSEVCLQCIFFFILFTDIFIRAIQIPKYEAMIHILEM